MTAYERGAHWSTLMMYDYFLAGAAGAAGVTGAVIAGLAAGAVAFGFSV